MRMISQLINARRIEAHSRHTPEKVRNIWYVDATNGQLSYEGNIPTRPFSTIDAAITAASAGDLIKIAEDNYDEAISIPAALAGLEVECEPGVIIGNTTPGTVVSIAASYVKWRGGNILQALQVGFSITGAYFTGENIHVNASSVSFDIDSDHCYLYRCVARGYSTTGFDISAVAAILERCDAIGIAATRGFYLSHTNAEKCLLFQCHSLDNTAAGYELVAGADENTISHCSQHELDAGPTDAGANNSWINHSQESQITAGNTLQEDLEAIYNRQTAMLYTMDFWSDPVEEKAVTAAQVTAAVGAAVVVHDLPAGATVVIAKVMFKFRMVENTNAAENSLDCTAVQPIQVDDSGNTGWVTAIDFVDEQFKIAATTREGGDVLIGDNNVSARVDGNDTYDFQWLNAKAHLANIQFNDIQMGIRIWYSV